MKDITFSKLQTALTCCTRFSYHPLCIICPLRENGIATKTECRTNLLKLVKEMHVDKE